MKAGRWIAKSALPERDVSCVVLSSRAEKAIELLRQRGVDVLCPQPCKGLLAPEQLHADLLMRHLGSRELLLSPDQGALAVKLRERGGRPMLISRRLTPEYPENVALNAALCGAVAFAKPDASAPELMDGLDRHGYRLHAVRQGYAGCGCAVVTSRAVMTSDPGIAKAAGEEGIDCLLLTPGHIRCDGFDCGLIGGCCGKLGPRLLAWTGDVDRHPDAKRMRDFCASHGVELLTLGDGPLTDFGGIIPLMEEGNAPYVPVPMRI